MLTASYNAIYGSDDDETELILRVAPLSATSEIQALFAANIIDYETAVPAALNSLGCSAEEIASAMDRRRKVEDEAKKLKEVQDQTNKAELERREEDAKNPPGDAKPATPKPASKPASEKADDD